MNKYTIATKDERSLIIDFANLNHPEIGEYLSNYESKFIYEIYKLILSPNLSQFTMIFNITLHTDGGLKMYIAGSLSISRRGADGKLMEIGYANYGTPSLSIPFTED